MNFYPVLAFLRHRIHAGGTAGHGVHSPFIYDFLTTVLRNKTPGDIVSHIESLRGEMLSDKRIIRVTDLGAGSLKMTGKERMVAHIARNAALPVYQAGLLARIAGSMGQEARRRDQGMGEPRRGDIMLDEGAGSKEHESGEPRRGDIMLADGAESMGQEARRRDQGMGEPRRGDIMLDEGAGSTEHESGEPRRGDIMIADGAPTRQNPEGVTQGIFLELGTSLGISTLAIALADPGRRLVTVEGCPELAGIAKSNLELNGALNAEVLNMEFTVALEKLRKEDVRVSFAFIDGNHRGEALINYIRCILQLGDEMIIVADDIHLSRNMYKAWQYIAESGLAEASVETNRFGILFRKNCLTPGRYRVWH